MRAQRDARPGDRIGAGDDAQRAVKGTVRTLRSGTATATFGVCGQINDFSSGEAEPNRRRRPPSIGSANGRRRAEMATMTGILTPRRSGRKSSAAQARTGLSLTWRTRRGARGPRGNARCAEQEYGPHQQRHRALVGGDHQPQHQQCGRHGGSANDRESVSEHSFQVDYIGASRRRAPGCRGRQRVKPLPEDGLPGGNHYTFARCRRINSLWSDLS